MNDAIDKAIKHLTECAASEKGRGDVLHITQAALNLAHVKSILSEVKD